MTTRVTTGEVRTSYFSALQSRKNEMNGKDEYSTQILIPKTDTATLSAMKAAAKEALATKFGDKVPKNVRNPLRDGDTETKNDGSPLGAEYKGHFFCNVKSTSKPGAIDTHGNDLIGSDDIVSGDYVRVSLNAYAYCQAGNNGVSFGLNNILLVKKGQPLGGAKPSAADDFGIGRAAPVAAVEAGGDDW
ncbi:DUF2815 family protein [Limnohabitans sp.]|uniref:DUF2815 family protein n=1 Tax=Limnohabitans sp. TaxID=1907725 RepID=UPI00333FE202